MCDKNDQDLETARTMLQIYHERSNQLANMLNALNGFMLAFIGALLGFIGSSTFSLGDFNPWPVIIGINIAIIVMILWRLYAHYIDDDIVNGYCKILFFEEKLEIGFDGSLLKSLILEYDVSERKKILEEPIDKRYRKIREKIQNAEIPDRGQKKFDCLTVVTIFCLMMVQFWILNDTLKTIFGFYFFFPIIILLEVGGIMLIITYKSKPKSYEKS